MLKMYDLKAFQLFLSQYFEEWQKYVKIMPHFNSALATYAHKFTQVPITASDMLRIKANISLRISSIIDPLPPILRDVIFPIFLKNIISLIFG